MTADSLSSPYLIEGYNLQLSDVIAVARHGRPVGLHPSTQKPVADARAVVEKVITEDAVVYGINTGFGYLKNKRIPPKDLAQLQRNLILSHACGVGTPFSEEVVRAIILLRTNTLVQGHSGIRQCVLDRLVDFLNHGVHPVIPSRGSVGASGDLAPLSHLALALIGEGDVMFRGKHWPTAQVLAELGWEPLELQAKEGLALINGTQPMSAVACMVLDGLGALLEQADLIAAMTLQVGMGSRQAFRPDLHALRPHPGQLETATNLWNWMGESEMVEAHVDCDQVQDSYAFRCIPQVHGASRDTYTHAVSVLTREINAVTDNPIIMPHDTEYGSAGDIISCGHFHGQPIAFIMDFAAIALSELANISERRIERLVNPQHNQGLPAFLSPEEGLNSGFMIPQYIAAALVSENKVLAHPASVDSIPTSANQEDHVSMGTTAANKALQILEHCQQVLGIELLCAAQAMDLRRPLKASAPAEAAYETLRAQVPVLQADRYLSPELEQAAALLKSKAIFPMDSTALCAPMDSAD